MRSLGEFVLLLITAKTFFNLYKNEDKALSKVNQRFPTSAAEFKKRERKKAPSFAGLAQTFS